MKYIVLLYSILAYLISVAGLVSLIAWLTGLIPGTYENLITRSPGGKWLWNLGLILLFGLQHSIMARSGFKNALIKYIPEAAERSTYVFASGIVILIMVAFWSPMPAQIWLVKSTVITSLIWIIFTCGWFFLLYATFGTSHFDLFGLRQAYFFYNDKRYTPVPFTRSGIYAWIRHPIQTGVLIGIWSTPSMTLDHLVLSTGLTLYIFVGLYYEERDLIKSFGEQYSSYRHEVGGLFPRFKNKPGSR